MSVLDISIVNVAILTMQNDFGVTTDEIQWVATSYELALGVVVPVSGWLVDRFGPTSVYVMALVGFTVFSAFCGLAWNLESMVAFRVLQAVPGGILGVVSLTIVYRIVPREKIGVGDGHVRAGHRGGPGHRPDPGRLLRRVRRLAVDLLHQRAGRRDRGHRRGPGAAEVPRGPGRPVRRARLPHRGHRAVLPAAGPDRGAGLGLDLLPGADPAHRRRAQPGPVRDHRAGGGRAAARRAGVPTLGVQQLATADRRAVGRPVHRAVLHSRCTSSRPRAWGRSRPGCSCYPRR